MKRYTKGIIYFAIGLFGLALPLLPGTLMIVYGIYLMFEPEENVTTK